MERMYFWNSYPFVRLSIVLISGIFCIELFPGVWQHFNLSIGALLLLFPLFLVLSKKIGFYKLRIINGIISLSIFFFLGGELVRTKYLDLPYNHYISYNKNHDGFSGTVTSSATERTNHFRYDFELNHITNRDSIKSIQGTIHLYIKKDTSNQTVYEYGDQLLIHGRFFEITGPGNPNEFNFKKYSSLQNIYSHAFVRARDVRHGGSSPPNKIFEYAYKTQIKAAQIIDKHISEPRENGIAKALLLGIKDHLDNEVKKSYSAAGAMHVLAVSGLHVGIVYLFLQFLFGGIKKTRPGRQVFSLISITVIWCYALITGLSPSVLRAATMFSIVAWGEIKATKGNIYNSLGLAAFVLLLVDPYLIYSVGFQLSFSAVFGIVYLQPKIYRLLEFNSLLADKAWAITCVSIAAQMATFPLTAYYFHQFPTYFLASNLVVIPAATIMLVGGISMLLFDPIISEVSSALGFALSKIIWFVNESVSIVESLPHSLINWIYLDLIGLISTYSIVIFLIWGFHHHSFKTMLIGVLLFLGFLYTRLLSTNSQSSCNQIIFYEIKEKKVIDHIVGHHAELYLESKTDDLESLSYQINPNRLASGLAPISTSIQSINTSNQFEVKSPFTYGILGGKKILYIDSTTFDLRFDHLIETDILVLENGSIKNLNWLRDHFQFKHLLIGNSNTRFYSNKMKQQAHASNIPIHSLIQDGAFILNVRK